MTKNKSTKKALFASALSLLLCFAMLIGTTYAWFTDSVTSTGNIIKSGTLDIAMEWADGKVAPASATWTDASSGAIFNYDKWEPGYTDVKHIRISNKGNLALKYQLNIAANGTISKLADVIDVYYMDPAEQVADRTALAAKTPMSNLTAALAGISSTANGNLEAGESVTVTIALKMQESAGNEYQDLAIGSDFTIQLLATQLTSETDSFDDQYDANATYGTYIELNAGDDLMAAMASAEADMPLTIKLNGDVEWPTTGTHGEKNITPASSIVIDGNGYTLTATGSGVTPLGDDNAPMTLRNITIVDKSVSYAESSWEFSYLEMGGKVLNCVNVDFADPIMVQSESATFTDCSFVGYEDTTNGIKMNGVWMANGDATFTNCTFTGTRGMKICDMYDPEVGTVVIDGCTFNGLTEKPGVAIDDCDTQDMNITIKNSTFINCQPGDQNLYVYETDNTVPTVENNTVVKQITVSTAEDLTTALTNGENVVLNGDIAAEAATTAPYGNKVAFIQNGGVLDGNGNTLSVECYGDDYGIMTSGGTIKNLTIDSGCRAIMIMSPTGDIIVDGVNIGGDGVLYTINTGEAGADGVKLSVTNSTLAGWTSYGPVVESASFTNVKFEQGEYKDYAGIYGRVLKPYVNTTLTDCSFIEHMNLDLSSLTEGHKVTFTNCTVNGQAVTADVFTPYAGDDSVYDTALFSVDLPSWADSIDDCIAFN